MSPDNPNGSSSEEPRVDLPISFVRSIDMESVGRATSPSEIDLHATLDRLREATERFGVPEFIESASRAALARTIAAGPAESTTQQQPHRLVRYGLLYERQGVQAYTDWVTQGAEGDLANARRLFGLAFDSWQALTSLDNLSNRDRWSSDGLDVLSQELGEEPLDPAATLAIRMSVSGLAAQRTADVRLELASYKVPDPRTHDWRHRVLDDVFASLVLLVRKKNGWEDIDEGLSRIDDLRHSQQVFEDDYLLGRGEVAEQTVAAVELLGLYHVAQMVTLTGSFLRDGTTPGTNLRVRLDRHRERATAAFDTGRWPLLAHLVDLTWVCCRELIANSIWTHVASLGQRAQEFARVLAARGRPTPVIELWPSQQEALRRNLLDPYPKAVLVEMPTSAGKTLLAKFAIIQTLALNPNTTIAYLVPTRALVNQITLDLRSDLGLLGLRVEQTVPAYELDPIESQLLESPPDVLVTTPEKFDLLLRRDHPSTQRLSMVVVDEAHNLRESTRGARLELVLGTVKRDRPSARFLLLSPFLPNDEELVAWLGDDRLLPPIKVDWKPGKKIVGSVQSKGRMASRRLSLETLPAADNSSFPERVTIPIGPPAVSETVSSLSRATVAASLGRGSVLLLCRGRGTAFTRARELMQDRPVLPTTDRREAVCRYIDAEVGRESALSECIRHGVAYHHSGMSAEARWLVQGLIKTGDINVVCGTTTLAQGVNFPITTVIVETLNKGDEPLSYSDFWNIAGRAGRALVDTVGVVAFPAPSKAKRLEYEVFLRGEAEEISSQLAELITRADELAQAFSLQNLRAVPELSSLLQFLAHAMRVGGTGDLADEVEDLLRASLVYHQAQRVSSTNADTLVRLCRSYLTHIRGTNPGILTLADHTGFATPSVLWLLGRTSELPQLQTDTVWQPDSLFGSDLGNLTRCVETIGGLPEIQLSEGQGRPFNPERVAAILRDWVQGASLEILTERYGTVDDPEPDKRVAAFSRYLYSSLLTQTSWGLGALETVCLGTDQDALGAAAYVPSMVYFGVKSPEAVWLRMVGLPRIVADGIADNWRADVGGVPQSYDALRSWVDNLSDDAWEHAIPVDSQLTPHDLRLLWREFVG